MSAPAPRHFLDLTEIPVAELRGMIEQSRAMKDRVKRDRASADKPLAGKTLAMIFDKPSTRTRVSFDIAMRQLGGDVIMLTGQEMQLGRGETIADTARVLSRYVDAIVIRILNHEALVELGKSRDRAGDQRADAPLSSLPGDGRRDDLRGEEGRRSKATPSPGPATPTMCCPRGCMRRRASTSASRSRSRRNSRSTAR